MIGPTPLQFVLFFLLAIGLSWEARGRRLKNGLRAIGVTSLTPFYLLLWLGFVAAYAVLYHASEHFWELGLLLCEGAGLTYLAREVRIAQEYEHHRAALNESLAEAELLEKAGHPDGPALLKAVKERINRLEHELPDVLLAFRTTRLVRGLALVLLAALGHGLLLFHTASLDGEASPDLTGKIASLERAIAHHGTRLASDSLELSALREENRRWHIRPSRRTSPRSPECHCQ